MNRRLLIKESRTYYQRYYRLVALAVVLMMMVLTGSLVLGDSVRGTLTDRVSERLGSAETIVATGTNFLSSDIMQSPLMANARGYLLVDGFLSDGGQLIPVYVWGTDCDSVPYGEAIINQPLADKLHIDLSASAEGWDGALHLPSHTLVPSGSLFVTKSYATQMRLHVSAVKDVKSGGNLLLKNEQTLPLNVFVNREQLAEVMELEGKINIIMSDDILQEDALAEVWTPEMSGIHSRGNILTTDRIFIQDDIVRKLNPEAKYFSYLVNDIINATDTVPYSFVTAVTEWQGCPLTGREMLLSDYAAAHLHVAKGDSVRMSYFLSKDLKRLETREQRFLVKDVVPLEAFVADSLLQTEFPGLSNVERCTDWDSDLPIHMDRIHKEDEDFWYKYHQTPKALVAYDAVADDWGSGFGTATALVLSDDGARDLTMSDAGVMVIHPREDGIYAAQHGTDFSSLFLALGFFIILSAVLLMQNVLEEMYVQRADEIGVYRHLGYTRQNIRGMLIREACGVIAVAATIGVLPGVLYSSVTLWLLGNVWSGATHTEGFALHFSIVTVLISWVIGIVICLISLLYVINKQIKQGV